MEAKEVCVEPNETLTRRERKAEATNPKDDNRDGEASEASGEHSTHSCFELIQLPLRAARGRRESQEDHTPLSSLIAQLHGSYFSGRDIE